MVFSMRYEALKQSKGEEPCTLWKYVLVDL